MSTTTEEILLEPRREVQEKDKPPRAPVPSQGESRKGLKNGEGSGGPKQTLKLTAPPPRAVTAEQEPRALERDGVPPAEREVGGPAGR
jgi:hypothetical protein